MMGRTQYTGCLRPGSFLFRSDPPSTHSPTNGKRYAAGMKIQSEPTLDALAAVPLYDAVGWVRYTADPARLRRAFAGSTLILTARADDGALIGLARAISDGETVCYVQDILMHPAWQRHGGGRALLTELVKHYGHCPFFLLSTDPPDSTEAVKSHPFYRSMGLIPHEEQNLVAFGLPIERRI